MTQKNNDGVILCIVSYKTMQTFDIVLKKMHRPSVNRFDGAIFLTIRTKVMMIKQKYEAITGVNYRADTKRFTHRRCKKLTSCQFLDDAKKYYQKF